MFVRPQADVRGYGSVTDNQLASSLLLELRDKIYESNNFMMDILVQNLSTITEVGHTINKCTLSLSLKFSNSNFLRLLSWR